MCAELYGLAAKARCGRLFRLAGLHELADQVRPSTRKPGQVEDDLDTPEVPGEETPALPGAETPSAPGAVS